MDKQTLRYIYLEYFRNQLAHNQLIDIQVLLNMAQNSNTAKSVLDDLVQEGFIEGIEYTESSDYSLEFISNEPIKLTEKGIKEFGLSESLKQLMQQGQKTSKLSNFPKQISENHKQAQSPINNQSLKSTKTDETNNDTQRLIITTADIIEKENNRIAQLSVAEKKQEIITRILYYFDNLKQNIEKYQNGIISSIEIKENIRNIVSKYYSKNPQIIAKKITTEIVIEYGYSTFVYQKNSPNEYEINKLLTLKGINYIKQIEAEKPKRTKIFYKENNIQIPESDSIKQPSVQLYNKLTKDKNKTQNNREIHTFEGILGQNCGDVIGVTGTDEKRLQVKGFKVENGIKVLRGYAKSSILADFSQPDKNYQRSQNNKHLNSLINFMENIKTSAKYLPEITLVARGYEKLEKASLSGKLTDSQQGELDNLEHWKLTVNKNQLFRIDGNHRLEATKKSSYYVPFSIIIWNNNLDNKDDEAFLFYFLNSKAKKLKTEENIKGLVDAKTWNNSELSQANILLPYIRYFKDKFENHQLFKKEYYKNKSGEENAKIQILNVLEIILNEELKDNESIDKLSFDEIKFGEYITETQHILSQKDRFIYLRSKFGYFPQFIFYSLYKNNCDTEKTINFVSQTDKWAQNYKHDSDSFMSADKMYNNASKQLNKKINIFVAMPYYNDITVAQFNTTMKSIVNELKQEDEALEEKLNLYPIMTYKAESTDILANMDKQICECDIFIADISNHGEYKVNPNVMFELGRVYDNKKFLLIRNKDNKDSDSAFDIQHIDYIPIDYDMGFDSSMKEKLKPRMLNIIKGIIGFC